MNNEAKTLRQQITEFMTERGQCCTWWFKGYMNHGTPAVRRELEKMEREGLVASDRSQANNTKWELVQTEPVTP